MMMPETEESLLAELLRTRSMLEAMAAQIDALSRKRWPGAKDRAQLASLTEQRERLSEGLKVIEAKLARLRPSETPSQ